MIKYVVVEIQHPHENGSHSTCLILLLLIVQGVLIPINQFGHVESISCVPEKDQKINIKHKNHYQDHKSIVMFFELLDIGFQRVYPCINIKSSNKSTDIIGIRNKSQNFD